MKKKTRLFLGIIVSFCFFFSCQNVENPKENLENEPEEVQVDTVIEEPPQPEDTLTALEHIYERGALVAVTNCSEINYNMYNSHPAGFAYEMLKGFCDSQGLKLEMVVNDNMDTCFNMLDSGEVDVVAAGMGLSKHLKTKYLLTDPIFSQKSVLVQKMSTKNQILHSPLDLAGKTVHVTKGLHTSTLLEHLSEEIGDTIYVVECDTLNPIELMHLVNEGKIDYTIVDEYIARTVSYNLKNVDSKLFVSIEQPIGWVVRQHDNDSSLQIAINEWIAKAKQKQLEKIMLRYIKNGRYISSRREVSNKRLTSFDGAIRKTADNIGWDWRLLAALIYQESRFKINLESPKGAYGLMQLMPSVMRRYGVTYSSSPEEQLAAGGRLITFLDNKLKDKVTDSLERVKFVLASYNAGLGHVLDAQRLAQKYGKTPDLWEDNVDYFILNKSKYLQDPCCKSGYLKGKETYRFVEDIMDRYQHYQALLE